MSMPFTVILAWMVGSPKALPCWCATITNLYGILATINLVRDKEMLELYNLDADPEELNNLHPAQSSLAADLLVDLKSKLNQAEDVYVDTTSSQ